MQTPPFLTLPTEIHFLIADILTHDVHTNNHKNTKSFGLECPPLYACNITPVFNLLYALNPRNLPSTSPTPESLLPPLRAARIRALRIYTCAICFLLRSFFRHSERSSKPYNPYFNPWYKRQSDQESWRIPMERQMVEALETILGIQKLLGREHQDGGQRFEYEFWSAFWQVWDENPISRTAEADTATEYIRRENLWREWKLRNVLELEAKKRMNIGLLQLVDDRQRRRVSIGSWQWKVPFQLWTYI
ncbi:hypothetical protein BJ508DRAFT_375715 [Ascobolus immersus RN42]|uniref:Uncharacterized protein n=1 Tax=Ascobolus immersus RN42 TaxID=1160509 RepID=A0A3N4IE19_ASCIM|nr:hypothetical protein BJ508DRAFT_375715 [Ascobolus immersus RN42]